jgi:hypothetical protein
MSEPLLDVETLRAAATRMRELAEGVEDSPAPWSFDPGPINPLVRDGLGGPIVLVPDEPVGRYIAAMGGVALAVADWLEASADFHEDRPRGYECAGDCAAVAVARAFLDGAS